MNRRHWTLLAGYTALVIGGTAMLAVISGPHHQGYGTFLFALLLDLLAWLIPGGLYVLFHESRRATADRKRELADLAFALGREKDDSEERQS